MAHKAEQILSSINTSINTISGVTAERSRFYALESDQVPFVIVRQGVDSKQSEYGNAFVDSLLRVNLVVFVDESSNDFETALSGIRKDINVKLLTDHSLGLSFVIDTDEAEAAEPEIIEGNQPRAMQILSYDVLYRRDRINPEN